MPDEMRVDAGMDKEGQLNEGADAIVLVGIEGWVVVDGNTTDVGIGTVGIAT